MNLEPKRAPPRFLGLYPIIDLDRLREHALEPIPFALALLGVRPSVLQVRAKATPPRETLRVLRALLPECHAAGTLLFANDRPDLALLAGCDGVHVGQTDLHLDDVRRFAPNLLVGVSTHNWDQLRATLELEPDYVAFGPVFATESKADADPVVGLAGLRRAFELACARRVPLVAIGGITLERVAELSQASNMVATISALFDTGCAHGAAVSRAHAFQAAFSREIPPLVKS